MRVKRMRDPERDKRRSMGERVDWFGESPHSSRKNIPRRRARLERSYRRRVNEAARTGNEDPLVEQRVRWKKWPMPTRAEKLERSRAWRAAVQESPVSTETARFRRSVRRAAK